MTLAVVALAMLLRFKTNPAWLIVGGALAGVGYRLLASGHGAGW